MCMHTGKISAFISVFVSAGLIFASTASAHVQTATLAQKQVAAAKTMLKGLKIVPRSNLDYSRTAQFGDAWEDVDRNGCDTRNDILERDLTREVFRDDCIIEKGFLNDPYTGMSINFVRGRSTSTAVQIDHVIPLSLAWRYGAHKWSQGKRVTFANDPINLIATDGPTNSRKSDSGPDEWLPPRATYQCTYVIRFIRIAHLYQVGVTTSMKSSMNRVLNRCTKVFGKPATLTPLSRSVWDYAGRL
jgi:hypothetical protein